MKNYLLGAIAIGMFAAACGGGGDDDVLIKNATVAQAKSFCEYQNDHGYAAKTCTANGTQVMVSASKTQDCSMITVGGVPATCTATIGDAKDCVDAISDDPCVLVGATPPAACAKIIAPSCTGDTTNLTATQQREHALTIANLILDRQ